MDNQSVPDTNSNPDQPLSNLQIPNSQISPDPAPQPKRTMFSIIVVLLVLILGCTTLYLYLQTRTLRTQLASSPTPTATPIPQSSSDTTAGWETYTNSKHNYSIKYPADYNFVDLTDGEQIEIYYQPNKEIPVGELLIEKITKLPPSITKYQDARTIGGVTAKCDSSPDLSKTWCILEESLLSVTFTHSQNDDSSYRKTLNDILSTFTFIDKKSAKTVLTKLKDDKSTLILFDGWTLIDNTKQFDLYQDGNLLWSQDVVIKYGEYSITSRNPLAWGPGICIFPDHKDYNNFEGMGTKYEKYTEFVSSEATYRRVSSISPTNPNQLTWVICSKMGQMGEFSSVAGYGFASYTTPLNPDSNTLATMDEILLSMQSNKY